MLSIVIPICNEYPQIMFTLEQLRLVVSYFEHRNGGAGTIEVIVVDNWCEEVNKQLIDRFTCPSCSKVTDLFRKQDQGGEKIESLTKLHPWLKYYKYQNKLSHWQAKNLGVQKSSGDVLFFMDGHCLLPANDLLHRMYDRYRNTDLFEQGTLHLPILYMLDKPERSLIYKPVINLETAEYHYSFTRRRECSWCIYEVPCMSTCGMMMSRNLYDSVGGWPVELGIYGGGENFLNYTLAVTGKHKYIYDDNNKYISHFAEKRGYNFNATDYLRNRLIATYIFGGEEKLILCAKHSKGRTETINNIVVDILDKCRSHRELINSIQVIDIDSWVTTVMPQLVVLEYKKG
jgi:glycosyltransferase involved in cell wall biosynthesis